MRSQPAALGPTGADATARSRLLDWLGLIVCNLIWASQFVLAKLVQAQMGPVSATLVPMAFATAALLVLVRAQRPSTASRPRIPLTDVVAFAVIGIFGQVLAQLGVTWGVRFAPASNAALLSLTLPIVTAVMAHVLLKERMSLVRWASFALAIAGVLQCSGVDWSELRFARGDVVSGNLLIMVGVAGSAFYNVFGKKLLERYTPLEVLLYSYYAVLACLVPLAIASEPQLMHNLGHFSARVWLGLGLLAALQYFGSMVLFLGVLKRMDALQAGLSNYLIPVFGLLIAALTLGERVTPRMAIGGTAVLASTLLITVYEEHTLRRRRSVLAAGAADNR